MTTLFISHSSKDKEWALRIHKALHGQGYQSLFLDSHPDDGIPAGTKWEQTLWQHLRQSRGVVVLCTANWLASPWCVAEVMMARERGKHVFLLATADVVDDRLVKGAQDGDRATQIPDFLKDTQFISLAGVTEEEAYRRLWQGMADEGLKETNFPLPKRPYPGLDAFQETDAAVFFGRNDEIERVVGALNRRRRNNAEGCILVLGASGCGKSSLVRAGVLPRLKRASGGDGLTGAWVIPPPFMAGKGRDRLVISLAHAFKEAGQLRDLAFVCQRLEAASGLRALANELLLAHGLPEGSVLLVIDQLEEVFGTPEGSEARTALRLLLDGSAEAGSPVTILATMRSDFLNAFQLFEGAANRYEGITLDPMPRSRFGELVEGPADRFGLRLDAGLSQRLIEDTAYDDALPLLAFTLEKLYRECGGNRVLTLHEYEKLFPEVQVRDEEATTTTYRGVSAAIKHAADQILSETGYAELTADDARMRDLRRAFYSLARVGAEGQFTRRTARKSQMPPSCSYVLDRFVEQRLLVSGGENGEPTLSVAHEALFRVWDTLRGWFIQDRKALALRAQIEHAAAEWDAENKAESRAWPEERIVDAVREIRRSGVSLDEVARAFLGPTDPDEIAMLTAAENATSGNGRYGTDWRPPLDHKARAKLGARLALLGDPRPGVGLRADGLPDIDWCQIDGAEVTIEIRSIPDDPNSGVAKTLTRAVEPFWVARYPVTVTQFEAFLADCRRDGAWPLPGFPVNLPARYQPPGFASPGGQNYSMGRHGNYPADHVNWWDASAFCQWLSTRLGYEIRLPTEYEWQQAAIGGGDRIYPWGSQWNPYHEPWRANISEDEVGRSTAVGMYPASSSQAGVQDMVCSLWEWCRNAFDDPDSTEFPATQGDRRVLRGGPWSVDPGLARSTVRSRNYPFYRSKLIGFRVSCSASIVEH